MTHRVERLALPAASPGCERFHLVHRFGAEGARPKAYLQAAIHADEIPGMLVLHHLLGALIAAERAGEIVGEVVVVPFANPIGLAQSLRGELLGRYEFAGGDNFNRGFPDLAAALEGRLDGRLGADAAANVAAIREAMIEAVAAMEPADEIGAQRRRLVGLACDADLVLDLHCDSEAILHLFVAEALWPGAADLAADLGCEAVMLADQSGGEPFDETFSRPWAVLAERFGPEVPIPPACLSATVELRGESDVDDRLATADAANLMRFLRRRGVLAGDPGPLPAPRCAATPLTGVGYVIAPAAGIVAYAKAPGDRVGAGETVAELVDPTAADAARIALASPTEGVLFGRARARLARPGDRVCKVAGPVALAGREPGRLLMD